MADAPAVAPGIGPFPLLWFSSNTPNQMSQTRCDYERWLTQHAGPHGTGYRLAATAVPLATGTGVHKGLELLGGWILDWQAAHPGQQLMQCPPEVIAWAATEAAERYEATARARGVQVSGDEPVTAPATEQLILEQKTLIEAQVWAWALVRLPALLAGYQLVEVEVEDAIVLDCTCGLSEAVADLGAHQARGCAGIGYMSKADQLWRRVGSHSLTYVQFKTAAQMNIQKRKQWDHSGQLLFDMEAASRRRGEPIEEAFIDYLIKGRRMRAQGEADTAPKTQHSYLCYGYYDAAVSLQGEGGWAAEYRWFDPVTGKNRQIPSSFQKVPIWEPERPLPVVREGASRVENWVRGVLTPLQLAKVIEVVGPLPNPTLRVPLAIAGIKAEERRFRADVEYLREQGAVLPGHPLVDQVIARSWNCTGFDGTPCVGQAVCNREIGWEDPEGFGRMIRRRPHHDPEAAAVEALGHVLPAGDEEEGDDGE